MNQTYDGLAHEFVRLRDLTHCQRRWVLPMGRSSLSRDWKRLKARLDAMKIPPDAPSWVLPLDSCLREHNFVNWREHNLLKWHQACQGVDKWWPTFAQGVQARQLGIPCDAGIHSTLDDGTDTLSPWLAGWQMQDDKGGNPEPFQRIKVTEE
jgi:hypothetical protein